MHHPLTTSRTGSSRRRLFSWLFSWRALLRWDFVVVCFATLIALFYAEENWRGKRAWETEKRQLEAKGQVLDWAAYTPAPVPDDQNIFKAPKMTQWFVRSYGNAASASSNDLLRLPNGSSLSEFLLYHGTNGSLATVAEVAVVPLQGDLSMSNADAVLCYSHPDWASLGAFSPDMPATTDFIPPATLTNAVIPLIVMDEAPILDAITNLAQQAGLKYQLDPNVDFGGPTGDPRPQPTVSVRWENITAQQALLALLNNYDLQLIDDAKAGMGRIMKKDKAAPSVYAAPAAREELIEVLQYAQTNGAPPAGPSAAGAQGYTFVATAPQPIEPARVFIRGDKAPQAKEIAELFSKCMPFPFAAPSQARVEPAGSNSFRVLGPAPYLPAADYLAWSDQFEPQLDAIREALRRPRARMEGDYQHPYARPIPNFIGARLVAQTLCQRGQCHLLLGQPEAAWHDLALVRDFCRFMEAKPVTVVSAMIEVAITGIYVNAVADGLRLHAWLEPQLTAIQEQLKQTDLLPLFVEGLESQRASSCRTLITGNFGPSTFTYFDRAEVTLWQKLKDPMFLFPKLAPRGWLQQNAAAAARLEQKVIDAADLANGLIAPHKVEAINGEFQTAFARFSPYNFIARVATPNFVKAFEVLARNQTMANEAQVVCALERYRLASAHYPETLDSLVPQFIEKLPLDIVNGLALKYHQAGDDQFLLYSVGWNETDEGGTVGSTKAGVGARDWVWQFPPVQ